MSTHGTLMRMPRFVVLRTPSANRVYAGEASALTAAELELTCPFAQEVTQEEIAGVGYLGFRAGELTSEQLASVARQSASHALFEVHDELTGVIRDSNADHLSLTEYGSHCR